MHPSWIPKVMQEAAASLTASIRYRSFAILALGMADEWYRFDNRPVARAFAFLLAFEMYAKALSSLISSYESIRVLEAGKVYVDPSN